LRIADFTWFSTVNGDLPKALAISALVRPAASRRTTSVSRGDSLSP
jgi:hypothetical protein